LSQELQTQATALLRETRDAEVEIETGIRHQRLLMRGLPSTVSCDCVFRSSRSRVSRQAGQPFRSKAFTGFGPWRSATSEETRDQ
jgi:hypothetical protein